MPRGRGLESRPRHHIARGHALNIEEVRRFVRSKLEEVYKKCKAMKVFPPQFMMIHSKDVEELALCV